MTNPRPDLPDEVYLVRRNTVRGKDYLADTDVQRTFLDSLAASARLYGQTLCALAFHTDGYAAVFHDHTGDRSQLFRQVHADTARHGRERFHLPSTELFWEHGRPEVSNARGTWGEIQLLLEVYRLRLERHAVGNLERPSPSAPTSGAAWPTCRSSSSQGRPAAHQPRSQTRTFVPPAPGAARSALAI